MVIPYQFDDNPEKYLPTFFGDSPHLFLYCFKNLC